MVTMKGTIARSRLAFVSLVACLAITTIAYSQDHIIPSPSLLQPFEWTYGCSPTAAAMVLSYWDNYEPGVERSLDSAS